MVKKKKMEYFEDKYGIKTLKTPISDHDKRLIEQLKQLLQNKSK